MPTHIEGNGAIGRCGTARNQIRSHHPRTALSGSYESLFSRRAILFRQRGLHEKELSEKDYRDLILEHYTFLKRPVVLVDDTIFVGNAKKTVEAAKAALH